MNNRMRARPGNVPIRRFLIPKHFPTFPKLKLALYEHPMLPRHPYNTSKHKLNQLHMLTYPFSEIENLANYMWAKIRSSSMKSISRINNRACMQQIIDISLAFFVLATRILHNPTSKSLNQAHKPKPPNAMQERKILRNWLPNLWFRQEEIVFEQELTKRRVEMMALEWVLEEDEIEEGDKDDSENLTCNFQIWRWNQEIQKKKKMKERSFSWNERGEERTGCYGLCSV